MDDRITEQMIARWKPVFDTQARYMNNGVYTIAGIYATDTRELFELFILQQEFDEAPE